MKSRVMEGATANWITSFLWKLTEKSFSQDNDSFLHCLDNLDHVWQK